MSGDVGSGQAIWIVLTPSVDDAGWRAALQNSAEAAGLTIRDADTELPGSSDEPSSIVWLTSSCETVESLGRTPTVVLIPRPETAAEAVAEKLGIFPPNSVTHASLLIARAAAQDPCRTRIVTAREIAATGDCPLILARNLTVIAPAQQTVESVRPAVQVALAAFTGGAPVEGQKIVWSERIYRYDQKAARHAGQIGQLDITGRPRILVYGPYLALTPGRWRAKIRFLVDKSAAEKEFRLDWGTPHDFTSMSVMPPHAGVFEVELEYDWNRVDFAEMRLWLMEGAFDGVLYFLGAELTFAGRPMANAA